MQKTVQRSSILEKEDKKGVKLLKKQKRSTKSLN